MLRKFVLLCLMAVFIPSLALLAQDTASAETCSPARPAEKTGMSTLSLTSGGEERNYLLYVPKTYDPAASTPLILSFHGFSSSPLQQALFSEWNALADKEGFLVAYPEGTGQPLRWNTQIPLGRRVNPDVQFVSDLIDTLSEQFCIDPARIYANGLSNGGGMSNALACMLSDRIAAIGGVSGAYLGMDGRCEPIRPVPIIAFHGTADPIVPYLGGPSDMFDIDFPIVPDWAEGWAERNHCDMTPVDLPAQGEVSGIHYTDCDENADVIFYTIDGGGHTWPGGLPLPESIVGKTSDDIEATQVMWDFFVAHPMLTTK
jgi:polyhydroxybutyrate depolymerase